MSVVHWTGIADLDTPVGAFLRLVPPAGEANSFLLESIEGGRARGRYSVIGMRPDLVWRCSDGTVTVERDGILETDARAPFDSLRALLKESRIALPAGVPPMVGGVFGYLGYDMVREMERLPTRKSRTLDLPDAVLIRPTLFVVFDHVRDAVAVAAPVRTGGEHAAKAHVGWARERLAEPLPSWRVEVADDVQSATPRSNMGEAVFLDAVRRARDYIAAGDVFQVVPSQRFSAPFARSSFELYRALRRINPAPFLFHLDFGGFALVGSSPEILVRLRDGTVTIRPLAGTRPRGVTPEEDRALGEALLADPKERAEHLMLIDLARHDVGRVCAPGSVRVVESFMLERFSHVMHISSTVEGRVRDGVDAVEALVAGFPAGTLTGAPKIRAMEIIDELEPDRRGPYAGCIGYFAADGSMDTCIGLRMAIVADGTMHVQAGAGIVSDSVPESELAETVHKSRALFRAAEEAVRVASDGTPPA